MQNTEMAALALDLEFFQSGLGLALLLVAALLAVVCILLTVLVVSSGATQRTLVAQLESANRLLVSIHEILTASQNRPPLRRPPMLGEPRAPSTPKPEQPPRAVKTAPSPAPKPAPAPAARAPEPPPRASTVASAHPSPIATATERRQASSPPGRPARGTPDDGHTDVYVSTDVARDHGGPARGGSKGARTDIYKSPEERARKQSERGGQAGDSTDIFNSVDV